MALTMTRTRTQTTLTKLVTLLANVNGELEFVRELLLADQVHRAELLARASVLAGQRQALCATLRQFDPSIDPGQILAAEHWAAAYRTRSSTRLKLVYVSKLREVS